MGVTHQHPDYVKMLPKWQRCRAAAAGQDEVKPYIPRLVDQSEDDYKAYKDRACYFNATWRTIASLNGMLFRKPPSIIAPEQLLALLSDADLSGNSIASIAYCVADEAMTVGIVGLLVDYPSVDATGITEAEASAFNLRPSLQLYKVESMINPRFGRVNNRYTLQQIVLVECEKIYKDEFEYTEEARYRVLSLDGGVYTQRVYRSERGKDELLSSSVPLMNGRQMDYIPFFFVGSDELGAEPPLIDLVDMNLAHLRVSADYEHGCHFTGLPTPVISGYNQQEGDGKMYIGSQSAWVFPNPDASAKFLEFTGQGLVALENNLRSKEQLMAILGARMLTADKKGIESSDTANIHRAGESSVLSQSAQNISEGISRALSVFSEWAGFGPDASIEINREFTAITMSADDAVKLMQLVQGGVMSHQSAFENMKRGGLYLDSDEFKIEQERINSVPLPIGEQFGIVNGG
jgi:hypothetical protein